MVKPSENVYDNSKMYMRAHARLHDVAYMLEPVVGVVNSGRFFFSVPCFLERYRIVFFPRTKNSTLRGIYLFV